MQKAPIIISLVLTISLAATGCTFSVENLVDEPKVTTEPTPTTTAEPMTPPVSEREGSVGKIVTLTPEQSVPSDVTTKTEPAGTFTLEPWFPNGFPAGVPAYAGKWIDNTFVESVNGESNKSWSLMFGGTYAEWDALLMEFEDQGWRMDTDYIYEDEGRRLSIMQNDHYKVIITGTESAKSGGEKLDASYTYTIVKLD